MSQLCFFVSSHRAEAAWAKPHKSDPLLRSLKASMSNANEHYTAPEDRFPYTNVHNPALMRFWSEFDDARRVHMDAMSVVIPGDDERTHNTTDLLTGLNLVPYAFFFLQAWLGEIPDIPGCLPYPVHHTRQGEKYASMMLFFQAISACFYNPTGAFGTLNRHLVNMFERVHDEEVISEFKKQGVLERLFVIQRYARYIGGDDTALGHDGLDEWAKHERDDHAIHEDTVVMRDDATHCVRECMRHLFRCALALKVGYDENRDKADNVRPTAPVDYDNDSEVTLEDRQPDIRGMREVRNAKRRACRIASRAMWVRAVSAMACVPLHKYFDKRRPLVVRMRERIKRDAVRDDSNLPYEGPWLYTDVLREEISDGEEDPVCP